MAPNAYCILVSTYPSHAHFPGAVGGVGSPESRPLAKSALLLLVCTGPNGSEVAARIPDPARYSHEGTPLIRSFYHSHFPFDYEPEEWVERSKQLKHCF